MSGRRLALVSTQWEGVFATATTPFAEDESLDLEALEARLVRLVDGGVGGGVVLGPLGEGQSLAPWERDAGVRRSVRAGGGPGGRGRGRPAVGWGRGRAAYRCWWRGRSRRRAAPATSRSSASGLEPT